MNDQIESAKTYRLVLGGQFFRVAELRRPRQRVEEEQQGREFMSARYHAPVPADVNGQPPEPSGPPPGVRAHQQQRPDRGQPANQNTAYLQAIRRLDG